MTSLFLSKCLFLRTVQLSNIPLLHLGKLTETVRDTFKNKFENIFLQCSSTSSMAWRETLQRQGVRQWISRIISNPSCSYSSGVRTTNLVPRGVKREVCDFKHLHPKNGKEKCKKILAAEPFNNMSLEKLQSKLHFAQILWQTKVKCVIM